MGAGTNKALSEYKLYAKTAVTNVRMKAPKDKAVDNGRLKT